MTPTTSAGTRPPAPVEPTHPCARCGAPVGPGVGLCERCNPLGLRDAAASQVHGTIFIAVTVAIVLLALIARLSLAGAGPFPASIDGVAVSGAGLDVTITVRNEGRASGQTTCRLLPAGDRGIGSGAFVLSPRIEAGDTVTFSAIVTELGSISRDLVVTCRTP